MKTALLYGGSSVEHEISILSALQVAKYFKKDELVLVYISKENKMYMCENLFDYDFYSTLPLNKCKEVEFEKQHMDIFLKSKGLFPKRTKIDLVFPLMHGVSGEDGTIQGLFEFYYLPYAQSKLSTCAIFMDKDLTRKMFKVFDIPHTQGITLHKREVLSNLECLKDIQIPKPWIIKPAKGGSSIGINCVYNDDQMNRKVCETLAFDNKVVLEEKLEHVREFNIAVIGNECHQTLSNIEEIHISQDIYSYTDKYGGSIVKQKPATRTCPAKLEESIANEIKELARKTFIDFECNGVVRFDFLYSDHLMMNEVNIIPGSYSIYLFKGILTPFEIIEILKKSALDQYTKNMKEIRTIDSFIFKKNWHKDYLKK